MSAEVFMLVVEGWKGNLLLLAAWGIIASLASLYLGYVLPAPLPQALPALRTESQQDHINIGG